MKEADVGNEESLTIHPSWKAYPKLIEELDLSKNNKISHYGEPINAFELIVTTKKKLDWKCSVCNNEWRTTGASRSKNGKGCSYCNGGRLHSDGRNSMANTHPELAKEYQGDATKITAGTHTPLDWKCSVCEHEWEATGKNRKRGIGCPACYGSLHSDGRNSMANTHPELAKEYQGDATKVIAGTMNELDWKCSVCNNEWRTTGASRSKNGKGCSYCNGGRLHSDGRNSMANTHPELAKEYQGDATKITAGTHTPLDWKCSVCEHEWEVPGHNRKQGDGCRVCSVGGFDPSLVGYVYILHYKDEINDWLKCGITNFPKKRYKRLSNVAKRDNIEVSQIDLFKFDDGYNASNCEAELLEQGNLRFSSTYDIEGKTEFFRFDTLEDVKKIIEKWL